MDREIKRIQDELLNKLKSEETKCNSYIKGYGDAISEIIILLDIFCKNKIRDNCQ